MQPNTDKLLVKPGQRRLDGCRHLRGVDVMEGRTADSQAVRAAGKGRGARDAAWERGAAGTQRLEGSYQQGSEMSCFAGNKRPEKGTGSKNGDG